jgi:hypothetical protein
MTIKTAFELFVNYFKPDQLYSKLISFFSYKSPMKILNLSIYSKLIIFEVSFVDAIDLLSE